MRARWLTLALAVGMFLLSLWAVRFVPQQFFPDSTRPELMVDIELAEGASLTATQAQAQKFEALIKGHKGVANFVGYVGNGSPRFYLPLDQQLPATNFAQYVVLAEDTKAREELRQVVGYSVADELTKLEALKKAGSISDDEYKSLRARAMANG